MLQRIINVLICIIVLSMSTLAFAEQKTTTPPTPTKPILVSSKEPTFTIYLKSNPTTGYRWFIKSYPADFIIPLKHHYLKPTSNLIGAPTTEVFAFKIRRIGFSAPHEFIIRFNYLRPFETENRGESKTFHIMTINDN